MDFYEEFPNANYGDEFDVDGDSIVYDGEIHTCSVCKKPAEFYSLSFLAYYCSRDCLNTEWFNYEEAMISGR